MDLPASLTNFFYNILPGIYLLLFAPDKLSIQIYNLLERINTKQDPTFHWILYLVLSLLIGFVLQGFTKIFRTYLGLDNAVYKSVVQDNDKGEIWKSAKKILSKKKLAPDLEENKEIFYLMDNYINSLKTNSLSIHFSARTSLWANLFWVNLLLLIPGINQCSAFNFFFLIFLIISAIITWLNLKAQQDTVLKSFLMELNNFDALHLNKPNGKSEGSSKKM